MSWICSKFPHCLHVWNEFLETCFLHVLVNTGCLKVKKCSALLDFWHEKVKKLSSLSRAIKIHTASRKGKSHSFNTIQTKLPQNSYTTGMLLLTIRIPYLCECRWHLKLGSTWWRSWLRQCATSQKVMGSIPDGVIGIFIDIHLLAALWPWGWLSL